MSREIVNTGGAGRVSADATKFGVISLVVAIVVIAMFWVFKANVHSALEPIVSGLARSV